MSCFHFVPICLTFVAFQVALKMKKQGIAIRAGDHIAYVICADDSQASYAQRAWSPADVHQVAWISAPAPLLTIRLLCSASL